jgi:hypothetical protein
MKKQADAVRSCKGVFDSERDTIRKIQKFVATTM